MTIQISFCTSIMNRLYQFKHTLYQNIIDSNDISEFIICDFSSNDGLKDYLYDNFKNYMDNGKIKYYYIMNVKYWHASVCKNITHNKANGKYIVNLDCDNFIGKNGDLFLLNKFRENGDNIIIHQSNNIFGSGNAGRISILKNNFISLGGYDESFYPMGYQDIDLIERGRAFGYTLLKVNDNNDCLKNTKEESMKYIGLKCDYKKMNSINKLLSKFNIDNNNLVANKYKIINKGVN